MTLANIKKIKINKPKNEIQYQQIHTSVKLQFKIKTSKRCKITKGQCYNNLGRDPFCS